MRLRLLVSVVLGLGAAGLWLWATGPGTTLPKAIIAWALAAGGFMLGWRLTRRPADLPEEPGPPTASTHPYGLHGEKRPRPKTASHGADPRKPAAPRGRNR